MPPKAVDARKRFTRNHRFRGHGPLLQKRGQFHLGWRINGGYTRGPPLVGTPCGQAAAGRRPERRPWAAPTDPVGAGHARDSKTSPRCLSHENHARKRPSKLKESAGSGGLRFREIRLLRRSDPDPDRGMALRERVMVAGRANKARVACVSTSRCAPRGGLDPVGAGHARDSKTSPRPEPRKHARKRPSKLRNQPILADEVREIMLLRRSDPAPPLR
jgi:hypothetical protein